MLFRIEKYFVEAYFTSLCRTLTRVLVCYFVYAHESLQNPNKKKRKKFTAYFHPVDLEANWPSCYTFKGPKHEPFSSEFLTPSRPILRWANNELEVKNHFVILRPEAFCEDLNHEKGYHFCCSIAYY
jgi:hypothetical protein